MRNLNSRKKSDNPRKSRKTIKSSPYKGKQRFKDVLKEPLKEYLVNFNLPFVDKKSLCFESRKGLIKFLQKLHIIQRIPKFISELYLLPFEEVKLAYTEVVLDVHHRIVHKGFVSTMKWFKTVHGEYLRYMSNSNSELPHNNLDQDGLIADYPHLNTFAKNCGPNAHYYRQSVSSMLQIFRMFEPKGESPSVESIVGPFPRQVTTNGEPCDFIKNSLEVLPHREGFNKEHFVSSWKSVVEEMFPRLKAKDRLVSIKSLTRVHVSSKNGPNGPSLPMVPLDFDLIKSNGLYGRIQKWIHFINNKDLRRLMWLLRIIPHSVTPNHKTSPAISRVAEKVEVGAKVRLFAMIDYITQSCFTGLHRFLFKTLSDYREDGTFDHFKAASKVKDLTLGSLNSQIHSVDLTTATDRIPVLMQQEIVSSVLGSLEMGDIWRQILTDRDFIYSGKPLRYAVGQPMGALSSWAMLAVSHHIVVRSCFKYFGKRPNGKYVIIGDDVVIVGDDVASLYEYIMSEVLSVPISKVKGYSQSMISGRNPIDPQEQISSVVELAKRVFYNGKEITGISPNIFEDFIRNPGSLPSVVPLMVSKLSTRDKAYYIGWESVKILSTLAFQPRLTVQMISLICSEAVSPHREPVSVSDIELYRIPWEREQHMFDRAVKSLMINSVENLSKLWESADSKLSKLTAGRILEIKARKFTVVWPGYKYLLRMVSKPLSTSLIEIIRELGQTALTFDNLKDITDIISKLEIVIDLQNIISGSETSRIPERVRLSQSIRSLFNSFLKEKGLVGYLEDIEAIEDSLVNQGIPLTVTEIAENIISIEWNDEDNDWVSIKLIDGEEDDF